MRLVVFSHKPCWRSPNSPSGVATDGGFAFHMRALSELFDETTLVLPVDECGGSRPGEVPLHAPRIRIAGLRPLRSGGWLRRVAFPFWLLARMPRVLREFFRADAVHTPIPGDVGTIGMLLALIFRKPLFVRHCGNWFVQKTAPERFWKWFMEKFAGGRNIMLATGGAAEPPSKKNPNVRWIFSTSLTLEELEASPRDRSGPLPKEPRLIIVCRQERAKGTDVVIQSLPLIRETIPGISLDVLGDGGALEDFKREAAALGLNGAVRFHGKMNHEAVLRLLKEADAFCYPTRASEGFPKVVLEAQACGLPVITTRVSVLPELIGRGGGTLLDEATPEAMARAVCDLLSNEARYREMSACALTTARQFSLEHWREMIGGWLRLSWGPLRKHG